MVKLLSCTKSLSILTNIEYSILATINHSSPSLLAKIASLKEDLPNEIDLVKTKYVSHLTSSYANNRFKLFKHLSSLKTTPTILSSVYYMGGTASFQVARAKVGVVWGVVNLC